MKCIVAEQSLMGSVKDAIILAGGAGTRMLPASLYMPKETMPLIDTPILNHLIWEAARAGASRIHIVLSAKKWDLLSHFFENGSPYDDEVRIDLPREALSLGVDSVEILTHIQDSSLGVADAISKALKSISGPFLVLLGDNILMSEHVDPVSCGVENASSASEDLVCRFERTGVPCVGVYPVDENDVSNYGVVKLSDETILGIVEKPSIDEAPSRYILCGRYLLPRETGDILDLYPVSNFGEMQSIRLLEHLIENGGLEAVKFDEMVMFDSGSPFSWLKSQVVHALRRKDLSERFSKWLREEMSTIENFDSGYSSK